MAGKPQTQCQSSTQARSPCMCGYYLLGIKQTSNKKDNETRKQLKMEVAQQQ